MAPPLLARFRLPGARPAPLGSGCSSPPAGVPLELCPHPAPRVAGRGVAMQCLGGRSRSAERSLQEQSLRVAALNGQRLGKGRRAPSTEGEGSGAGRRVPVPLWDLLSTAVSV